MLVRGGDPAALAEAEPLLVASHGRGDPDAAWALARIARAQGRDAEADQWTALVPPDCAPAAVSRAEAALAAGDLDAAIEVLVAGSASVDAVAMLGRLLFQFGHPEAADVLRAAVERGDTGSAVPLARLLFADGRREEALAVLAKQPSTGEAGGLHAALAADATRLTELAEHGHAHAAEDLIRRAGLDGAQEEVMRWASLGAEPGDPPVLVTIAEAAAALDRLDEVRPVFAELYAANRSIAAAQLLDRMSGADAPATAPLAERAASDWALLRQAERTADVAQRIAMLRRFEDSDYLLGRAQLALSLLAAGEPGGLELASSVPYSMCADAVAEELRDRYEAQLAASDDYSTEEEFEAAAIGTPPQPAGDPVLDGPCAGAGRRPVNRGGRPTRWC